MSTTTQDIGAASAVPISMRPNDTLQLGALLPPLVGLGDAIRAEITAAVAPVFTELAVARDRIARLEERMRILELPLQPSEFAGLASARAQKGLEATAVTPSAAKRVSPFRTAVSHVEVAAPGGSDEPLPAVPAPDVVACTDAKEDTTVAERSAEPERPVADAATGPASTEVKLTVRKQKRRATRPHRKRAPLPSDLPDDIAAACDALIQNGVYPDMDTLMIDALYRLVAAVLPLRPSG